MEEEEVISSVVSGSVMSGGDSGDSDYEPWHGGDIDLPRSQIDTLFESSDLSTHSSQQI